MVGIVLALSSLGPVGLAAAAVIGMIGAAWLWALGSLEAEVTLIVESLKGLTGGQGMEMAKSLAAIAGGVVLMGIAGR